MYDNETLEYYLCEYPPFSRLRCHIFFGTSQNPTFQGWSYIVEKVIRTVERNVRKSIAKLCRGAQWAYTRDWLRWLSASRSTCPFNEPRTQPRLLKRIFYKDDFFSATTAMSQNFWFNWCCFPSSYHSVVRSQESQEFETYYYPKQNSRTTDAWSFSLLQHSFNLCSLLYWKTLVYPHVLLSDSDLSENL